MGKVERKPGCPVDTRVLAILVVKSWIDTPYGIRPRASCMDEPLVADYSVGTPSAPQNLQLPDSSSDSSAQSMNSGL